MPRGFRSNPSFSSLDLLASSMMSKVGQKSMDQGRRSLEREMTDVKLVRLNADKSCELKHPTGLEFGEVYMSKMHGKDSLICSFTSVQTAFIPELNSEAVLMLGNGPKGRSWASWWQTNLFQNRQPVAV